MLEFKLITPLDKEVFDRFDIYKESMRNCEVSFANLCAWSFKYHGEYAIIDNCLITRAHYDYNKIICYHCPIGEADKIMLVNKLITDSKENNYQLKLVLDCKEVIQEHFKDMFTIYDDRDFYDYIYLRASLASLVGKKLQAKRNHCNKFERLYPDYRYVEITRHNVYECVEFGKKWLDNILKDTVLNDKERESYEAEQRVIKYFADYFDELGLIAAAIYVGDKMIAFTIGSKINNDTLNTHIEKADTDYEGSYSIINRDFARKIPPQYIYINREEDLRLEGLRKAKLSYNPIMMIEKQIATLK